MCSRNEKKDQNQLVPNGLLFCAAKNLLASTVLVLKATDRLWNSYGF